MAEERIYIRCKRCRQKYVVPKLKALCPECRKLCRHCEIECKGEISGPGCLEPWNQFPTNSDSQPAGEY